MSLSLPAQAQPVYWTGQVNEHWEENGNWNTGTVPGRSDTVYINNGGHARISTPREVQNLHIGENTGESGSLTVDGPGSKLEAAQLACIGNAGTGTLTLSNGGTSIAGQIYIGNHGTGIGSVTVDGVGSRLETSRGGGRIVVGNAGTGTLTLSNDGIVSTAAASPSGSVILIARLSGSIGTLNVGSGGRPGIVDATGIDGGGGSGTVNFNHNATGASPDSFPGDGTRRGTPSP